MMRVAVRAWAAGAVLAGAAVVPARAEAATAVGAFQVRIEILKSCRVRPSSAGGVGSEPIDVSCTVQTPYAIELSPVEAAPAETRAVAARSRTVAVFVRY